MGVEGKMSGAIVGSGSDPDENLLEERLLIPFIHSCGFASCSYLFFCLRTVGGLFDRLSIIIILTREEAYCNNFFPTIFVIL